MYGTYGYIFLIRSTVASIYGKMENPEMSLQIVLYQLGVPGGSIVLTVGYVIDLLIDTTPLWILRRFFPYRIYMKPCDNLMDLS